MFKSSFNETIECSSLDYDNCYEYSPTEADGTKRCISKKDESGCELKDCNELDSDRCDEYYHGDSQYRCQKTENGKACELKKCSDYKPENCGKFETNIYDTNCISYNGKCEEKKCNDLSASDCAEFTPKNLAYKCGVSSPSDTECSLIPKECKDVSYEYCNEIPSIISEDGTVFECTKKADKSGCELQSCKDQSTNNCGNFIPHSDDQKCVLNSQKTQCEIKSCSGYNSNECGNFTPNDKSKKCYDSGSGCEITYKNCEEFSSTECENYYPYSNGNGEQSCMPAQNGKCSLVSCESLKASECQNFRPNSEYKQCINIKNSCQLLYCDDLSSSDCGKFITDNLSFKCVAKNNRCISQEKECSELPVEYCTDEKYERDDGVICVLNEKKNKCKVEGTPDGSQQIYLTMLSIILMVLIL